MSKGNTLVIMYPNLQIGGIEKWLIELIDSINLKEHRIVWLRYGAKKIHSDWEKLIKEKVEIYKTSISFFFVV